MLNAILPRSLWGRALVLALLPLLVWGCDRASLCAWVGATDLEVEFVVTDATGQPVPWARIDVQSDGGFYRECDEKAFTLTADSAGTARRVCHHAMCYGTT